MMTYRVVFLFVAILLLAISIAIKIFPLSTDTKISLGYSNSAVLNFTEVAAKHQYRSEEHTVVTKDGYVLTIFRIIQAKNCHQNKKKRPVLIMHGLLQNSDIFLDAGPSAGLAYLLSDACFDVWVGNQRGNNYSRKHLRLNPDIDPEFWKFSVDEIGLYDVPASIDHIFKQTNADKINYVGYSQGSGIFFIMCSERPDYCRKTGVMLALAPGAILLHHESLLLKFVFRSAVLFEKIFNLLGIHEVFPKGHFCQEFLEYICQFTWTDKLCASAVFLDNYHEGSIAFDARRLIFSHLFVGTSLNILVRYGQSTGTEKFQKLDYGEEINLKRYNNTSVPEYNLTSVTAPVVLIHGRNDNMINLEDSIILSKKLPNVLEMAIVSDPKWNHFDMIYSKNIKTMIYPKMYEYLQKYS